VFENEGFETGRVEHGASKSRHDERSARISESMSMLDKFIAEDKGGWGFVQPESPRMDFVPLVAPGVSRAGLSRLATARGERGSAS
jgi:hypothetical protein